MTLIERIKVFDFYKSIPDQVSEKTFYGAIITCIMVAFICFSVYVNIYHYYNPKITSEMYVDDITEKHELQLFINVTLLSVPCALSPLIVGSTIDNSDRILTKEVNLYRINKHGNVIGKYFMEDQIKSRNEYPLQMQNE